MATSKDTKETAEERDLREAREAAELEAEERRLREEQEAQLREREERDLAEARGETGTVKPKLINVVSTLPAAPDGGNQVAVFETDAAHPGGQAYVAGPRPAKVAATAAISQAIHEGRAREITDAEFTRLTEQYNTDRRAARADALQAIREQNEASNA